MMDGLVPKRLRDSLGRLTTRWVRPGRGTAPAVRPEAVAPVPAVVDERTGRLAHQVISDSYSAIIAERPNPLRHRFHPSRAETLEADIELLTDRARSDTRLMHDRRAAELVTAARVRAYLEGNHARRARVVSDPVLLNNAHSASFTFTVQHRASGIRARFEDGAENDAHGVPLWTVYSKQHDVPGIGEQGDPDDHDAMEWRGLGIGTRVYEEGARLRPDVRWRNGSPVSAEAQGVRRKLHASDPYRWQGRCDWCEQRGIDWMGAEPSDFADHP